MMNKLISLQEMDKLKQFAKAIDPVLKSYVNEFTKAVERIAEIITPIFRKILTTIKNATGTVLLNYPNRRVVWLALNHRKRRIRKKNLHRIILWFERMC